MKAKLSYQTPKLLYLFVSILFLNYMPTAAQTAQSFGAVKWGVIEGFEFTNGHESVQVKEGSSYAFDDLPGHFYLNAHVSGYAQSVKFEVTNIDTGEVLSIVENLPPYTFPAGNGDWDIGKGSFAITATLYKKDNAEEEIQTKTIMFIIGDTNCSAMAGTMSTDMPMVSLIDGKATVQAMSNGDAYIPDGYVQAYVLTMGEGLVIKGLGETPEFKVEEAGDYTIHSIVFDPETLDTSIVVPGQTTGFDVNGLLIQGGGMICASLDVAGAKVSVEECKAMAGTMSTDMPMVSLIDGKATVQAMSNGDAYIPDGYVQAYVLTMGEGLVIKGLGETPEFKVEEAGDYTIHSIVFDPETLDTSIVVPGQTTGFDVNGLLIQGGGMICASLDVAGAKVSVEECKAMAGTMSTDMPMVSLIDGKATVQAMSNGDAYIPDGYVQAYVLTMGEGLVIKGLGETPEFKVEEAGDYTIHSIVFDPETLDTDIVVPGQTTGFDVNGLLIQGGGMICASLDVAGAKVSVMESEVCVVDSGSMYSKNPINCLTGGIASISARINDASTIPSGYSQLFVLTEAFSLTILGVSNTPEFEVSEGGFYRIHSLVYNPETLDLSGVVPGQTTGFDVVGIINDNDICASLDVQGAVNLVIGSRWFCYFFNKYFNRGDVTSKSGSNKGDDGLDLEQLISQYNSYEDFKNAFIDDNMETRFYPNPVVNVLNVEMEVFDQEVMNYSVMDVSGRLVMSGAAKDLEYGKQTLDFSRLNSGVYLVQFVSDQRTITKKIMIRN
ncbi:T9SS type A sorting domain-containing protein [Cognatitamlana onchidii]|uniref:T9SS type A sorting domain-containing protein n=1 Tax=Cognatitamlana onchidii TaxID=2562860 RepID=UPI001455FC03|nr:T9SS type A sorting domain-containing protein [Algibacter onchidii]